MRFTTVHLTAAFAALALALCAASAAARDLGKVGPTYPIAEPDLLEEIQIVLKQKEATGELARLQDEAQRRAIDRIQSPTPVAGLARTTKARTHYFDPSITIQENITDGRGNVIVAAGTRNNPLNTVTMTRQMFFFDGRDPDQVRFARAKLDELGGRLKPILVAGSYMDLMKSWQVQVFYDQDGALVRRLGISQVPALVAQDGKRLRVDELVPPTSRGVQ
jgi:conjugal transfer pilus assembly protein TraW